MYISYIYIPVLVLKRLRSHYIHIHVHICFIESTSERAVNVCELTSTLHMLFRGVATVGCVWILVKNKTTPQGLREHLRTRRKYHLVI